MGVVSPKLRKVLDVVKPDAYIPVIVELAVPLAAEPISELEGLGLSVKEKFATTNMVSGRIQAKLVEEIAKLPVVKTVYYDEPLTVAKVPFFRIAGKDSVLIPVNDSYTVKDIGAVDVWQQFGYDGKGVKVAVLDTGADLNHPMLAEAIKKAESMVPGESAEDGHGHGSWCAGCIAGRPYSAIHRGQAFDLVGVAPESDLIVIKVLGNDGSGQTSYVLKGMEKAHELGADIVSMSLGSVISEAGHSPDSKMVEELAKKGVLFSVAAGNQFVYGAIGSPGDSKGALTVASVSHNLPAMNVVSTFSSKGPTIDLRLKPDVAAFGGNILPTVNELLVSAGANGSLDEMAGTSMATPHVSGVLALLVQAGMPKDRDTAEYALGQSAVRRFPVPKDINRGWGLVNAFNAINQAWWESPTVQTFDRFIDFVRQATFPIGMAAVPVSQKLVEMFGIETQPKLAIIAE